FASPGIVSRRGRRTVRVPRLCQLWWRKPCYRWVFCPHGSQSRGTNLVLPPVVPLRRSASPAARPQAHFHRLLAGRREHFLGDQPRAADLGVQADELRALLDLVDRQADAAAVDPGDGQGAALADAGADVGDAARHRPADQVGVAALLDLRPHHLLLAVAGAGLRLVLADDVDAFAQGLGPLVDGQEVRRVFLGGELGRAALALGVEAHLERVALQLVDAEHGVVGVLALADGDVDPPRGAAGGQAEGA